MFNELYRCCPQQWDPIVNFPRAILWPTISQNCLGISTGSPRPTELNITQACQWEICLTTLDWQFRLHISHYYESSVVLPSQIPASFSCTRLPNCPANTTIFSQLSSYSPSIPSPHKLIPPTPNPTWPQSTSKLYFPIPGRSLYPAVALLFI